MAHYYDTCVTDIAAGKNAMRNGVTECERARIIRRTLGVTVAAKYLRNRGWSVQAASFILFGK